VRALEICKEGFTVSIGDRLPIAFDRKLSHSLDPVAEQRNRSRRMHKRGDLFDSVVSLDRAIGWERASDVHRVSV
jgi:hypothetical protein